MPTTPPPELVIPYGCAAVPPDLRSLAPKDWPIPWVAIEPARERPLRLNDGQYRFSEPPDPTRLADHAAKLDFLRDHLQGFCDLWAKNHGRFLDRYFAFVSWRIGNQQAALGAALAAFEGLYRIEDFCFSALRPLPRAHLPMRDGGWARTDFAFWTGRALVALEIADARRTPRQRQADLDRLTATGAIPVVLPPAALDGEPAALLALLPDALATFWLGETLPASPFTSTSLADIVDEALPF